MNTKEKIGLISLLITAIVLSVIGFTMSPPSDERVNQDIDIKDMTKEQCLELNDLVNWNEKIEQCILT